MVDPILTAPNTQKKKEKTNKLKIVKMVLMAPGFPWDTLVAYGDTWL